MKMKHVSRRLRRFLRTDKAVSALEYAILVGVIAIAVGAGLAFFGNTISDTVNTIGNNISGAHSGVGTP